MLVQSRVVERLPPEEQRNFRATGRPLGGSGFARLLRELESGLGLLDMLKESLDRGQLLRLQTQPRVLVPQNVHLIMLPAEFPPQFETALLDRNADQRNQHDDADSTAEAEEHETGVGGRQWAVGVGHDCPMPIPDCLFSPIGSRCRGESSQFAWRRQEA